MHLLISHWSVLAAWVLTGLSLYSFVWIAGDAQAIRLQPHALTASMLHLRAGLRSAADVPIDAIANVRRFDERRDRQVARLIVMGTPRLVLELDHPVELRGLLGSRTSVAALACTADDEAGFLRAIDDARRRASGTGPTP